MNAFCALKKKHILFKLLLAKSRIALAKGSPLCDSGSSFLQLSSHFYVLHEELMPPSSFCHSTRGHIAYIFLVSTNMVVTLPSLFSWEDLPFP